MPVVLSFWCKRAHGHHDLRIVRHPLSASGTVPEPGRGAAPEGPPVPDVPGRESSNGIDHLRVPLGGLADRFGP